MTDSGSRDAQLTALAADVQRLVRQADALAEHAVAAILSNAIDVLEQRTPSASPGEGGER